MKNIFYCLIVIALSSCGSYINNSENKTEKIFVSWNLATANSLQLQERAAMNEYQKSLYKNRLQAFKSYIGVDDLNQINKNSIRYMFVKQCFNFFDNKIYIIETNESGERNNKVSYIIIPNGRDASKVFKYIYEQREWVKMKEYVVGLNFKFDKTNYTTTFGQGKNENDITVTCIDNGITMTSDFFLLLSMKQLEILELK